MAATVAGGQHEALVVGYKTELDPAIEGKLNNAILGFYVFDPWHQAGFGNMNLGNGYPGAGYAPNSYVTVGTWHSTLFLPDKEEGSFYMDKYVIVARKSTATSPVDAPAPSYGEDIYSGLLSASAPTITAQTSGLISRSPESIKAAAPSAHPSIAEAIAAGIEAHELTADASLGVDLLNYSIGRTLHVDALVDGILNYSLVELVTDNDVIAVALVEESEVGFRFGAISPVDPGFTLPTPSDVYSVVRDKGLTGTSRAGWAWSTERGNGPFYPLAYGIDSESGRARYFTLGGREVELDMPSYTARMP